MEQFQTFLFKNNTIKVEARYQCKEEVMIELKVYRRTCLFFWKHIVTREFKVWSFDNRTSFDISKDFVNSLFQ